MTARMTALTFNDDVTVVRFNDGVTARLTALTFNDNVTAPLTFMML